jgi:hypothetical protein
LPGISLSLIVILGCSLFFNAWVRGSEEIGKIPTYSVPGAANVNTVPTARPVGIHVSFKLRNTEKIKSVPSRPHKN